MASVNADMRLSAAGWKRLQTFEQARLRDPAGSGAIGTGTQRFPALGAAALSGVTAASAQAVNTTLATRVSQVEALVRRAVRDRMLTQDQFDALVSFSYSLSGDGPDLVLNAANSNDDASVASLMPQYVYVYRGAAKRVLATGLVARRTAESASFKALARVASR